MINPKDIPWYELSEQAKTSERDDVTETAKILSDGDIILFGHLVGMYQRGIETALETFQAWIEENTVEDGGNN